MRSSWIRALARKLLMFVEAALNRVGYRVVWWPRVFFDEPEAELKFDLEFIVAQLMLTKRNIFFLEIGANDGVSGDPLFPFIKKFDWQGVMLEPVPETFELLERNYQNFSGVTLLNVALSERDGTRTMYMIQDEKGSLKEDDGLHSEFRSQLTSFVKESVLSQIEYFPNVAEMIKEVEVECICFETLLSRIGRRDIDILQIDAEGYDYQILKMIDFTEIRPMIINFEHCLMNKATQEDCSRFLFEQGYRMTKGDRDTTAYLFPNWADQFGPIYPK